MKHLNTVIATGVALSTIGTAAPQDRNAGQLNADQVTSWIQAAGYTDVQDVRRDGDHFDAVATGKDGKRVALDVDANTGAITPKPKSENNEKNEKDKRN